MRTDLNDPYKAIKQEVDKILNHQESELPLLAENPLAVLNRLIINQIALHAKGNNNREKTLEIIKEISKRIFDYLKTPNNRDIFIKNLDRLHANDITNYAATTTTELLLDEIEQNITHKRQELIKTARLSLLIIALPVTSLIAGFRTAILVTLPVMLCPNLFLFGKNKEDIKYEEFITTFLRYLNEPKPSQVAEAASFQPLLTHTNSLKLK